MTPTEAENRIAELGWDSAAIDLARSHPHFLLVENSQAEIGDATEISISNTGEADGLVVSGNGSFKILRPYEKISLSLSQSARLGTIRIDARETRIESVFFK